MNSKCSNLNCYAPDESCMDGHIDLTKCDKFVSKESIKVEENASVSTENAGVRVSWSGNHLGLTDIQRLTYQKKPIVIGLLGASDAGKTTFLLGCYLQLLKGQEMSFGVFAGSYTLEAWESLAHHIRFNTPCNLPKFPPHTPRGIGRIPGLLHLALRKESGEIVDLLLTDAPGEWFSSWSINEDAEDAQGARWIVQHSDAYILAADSEKLSSPETSIRGKTKSSIRALLDRLHVSLKQRHLTLLWTKSEDQYQIKDVIRASIRDGFSEAAKSHWSERYCTIQQPDNFLRILDETLKNIFLSSNEVFIEPIVSHRPFEAFRGSPE